MSYIARSVLCSGECFECWIGSWSQPMTATDPTAGRDLMAVNGQRLRGRAARMAMLVGVCETMEGVRCEKQWPP
jgi:hypothetical protein